MRARRTLAALVAAAAVVLLGGCIAMPESGPVRDAPVGSVDETAPGSYYDPPGPRPGGSPRDVVLGFLDAMQAAPIRTDVAREFLTQEASDAWDPQQQTLVYANRPSPQGSQRLTVTLEGLTRLGPDGTWLHGADPREEITFPMVQVDEEWRIDEVPNALIVPETWFDQWFTQHNVYFFDQSGRFLLPQPVHVPTGDQLPTVLLASLLRGPGPELAGVARSFLPENLERGLSVPVSDEGVADVILGGDAGQMTAETQDLMLAQIAWTLRADPEISSFRVRIGGSQLRAQDGTEDFSVTRYGEYDPSGLTATSLMFALVDGVLASGSPSRFVPVDGDAGTQAFGWSDFAVNPAGDLVAGVSADRTALTLAGVRAGGPEADVVLSGAGRLARPAWDLADRLWLLDRGRGRARFLVMADGSTRTLEVPGVSGRDVRAFLVSRDGTRLVSVVRGAGRDRVLVSRVAQPGPGRLEVRSRPIEVDLDPGVIRRIVDIAWHSPSAVSVLHRVTEEFSQVTTFSVDGSSASEGAPAATVRGRGRALVSAPDADGTAYVVVPGGLVLLGDPAPQVLESGVDPTSVTYAG